MRKLILRWLGIPFLQTPEWFVQEMVTSNPGLEFRHSTQKDPHNGYIGFWDKRTGENIITVHYSPAFGLLPSDWTALLTYAAKNLTKRTT